MSCHLPHGHSSHCHGHHGHSHTHGHGHSHHCHKPGHSHSSSSEVTKKVAGHCKKPAHGQPSHQPQPIQHAAQQPAGQPSTTAKAKDIHAKAFGKIEAARRQPQPQPQVQARPHHPKSQPSTPKPPVYKEKVTTNNNRLSVSHSSKITEKTQPQANIPPAPPAPPLPQDLLKSVPAPKIEEKIQNSVNIPSAPPVPQDLLKSVIVPKTEEKAQPQTSIPSAPPAPPLPQDLLKSTLVQPEAVAHNPPANVGDLLASIRAFDRNQLNNVNVVENNNLNASRVAPAAGGNDLLASLLNSKIFNGIKTAQTDNNNVDTAWDS